MKITPHFFLEEFRCHDKRKTGYPKEWIETRLITLCGELELIRGYFGRPVIINSGFRTVDYNRSIGGARHSQHVNGKAVDVDIETISPEEIAKFVFEKQKKGSTFIMGVGLYPTFIHLDIRERKATWRGSRDAN